MLERHRQVDLRDTAFTALYYEAYRLITRLQHDRTPGPWLFDPLHAVLRALRRAR
jgi:hypothetical protein